VNASYGACRSGRQVERRDRPVGCSVSYAPTMASAISTSREDGLRKLAACSVLERQQSLTQLVHKVGAMLGVQHEAVRQPFHECVEPGWTAPRPPRRDLQYLYPALAI